MSYYYNLLKHNKRLSLGPVFNKENRAYHISETKYFLHNFFVRSLASVESRESASNRGAEYSYFLAKPCSNNVE